MDIIFFSYRLGNYLNFSSKSAVLPNVPIPYIDIYLLFAFMLINYKYLIINKIIT